MAISNSLAAAAASSAELTTPSLRAAIHSDQGVSQRVSQVAQHIFGEFHVHVDLETSDIHIIHSSQASNPEVVRRVNQLATTCLSNEEIVRKEKLVSGGQEKIEQLQPRIDSLNAQIDKMSRTIASLEKELADCEAAIAEKMSKNKLSKLISKGNEAEVKELIDKKNDLEARKSGWVGQKKELETERDAHINMKQELEKGMDRAQQAVRPTQQTTQFRQKLQEKLLEAGEGYQALGCIEHEGRAIVETPQGRYDFGLSPAALKMTIAVSLVTEDVAKDRIIRLHTSTPDASSLATHDFYHISPQSSEASLVHKHGTPFASGGKGDVYRAFEFLSKQVRVLKEIKDPDEDSIEEMQTEYTLSCAANPDNMRPGLAHKPHACFDLRREEFGGIGLIFDLHNRGDISKQLGKLTVQDQAKGLLSIFNANSSLSANNLLHLDIKPENVFLHESPEGLSMVVADFDGMWRLDQSTKDFVGTLRDENVPDGSPNSRTNAHVDHLIMLKKKICDFEQECNKAKGYGQLTKKMQDKLEDLIASYKVTATCVQNWGAAYTALQIVTGTYSADFNDRDALLNSLKEKIKACEKDSDEQKFLIGVMGVVAPILRAPLPTIYEETGRITDRNMTTADEALRDIRTHVQHLGIIDEHAPSVLSSTAAGVSSAAAAASAPNAVSSANSSRRMSVRYDASVVNNTSTARRNTSPPLRSRDTDTIQQ